MKVIKITLKYAIFYIAWHIFILTYCIYEGSTSYFSWKMGSQANFFLGPIIYTILRNYFKIELLSLIQPYGLHVSFGSAGVWSYTPISCIYNFIYNFGNMIFLEKRKYPLKWDHSWPLWDNSWPYKNHFLVQMSRWIM